MLRTDHRRNPRRAFRPTVDGLEHRWLQTTVPTGYTASTITLGLHKPTVLAVAPDGRVFIALQWGQIRIMKDGKLLPKPLMQIPVDSNGERGLVGMALDPNFAKTPYIYVYYTLRSTPGKPTHNRVSRFLVTGDAAYLHTERVLLNLPDLGNASHNAGSLSFGKDGKLYIGVGDNSHRDNSQSLNRPFGKILRINPDGSIPTDNPYYATKKGINRTIWAYGLRNPFGSAVERRTGLFFINDTGENTWEEVNVGVKGANYGWPKAEGPTTAPGIRAPRYAYRHGTGENSGAAITGATFDSPTHPLVTPGSYYFTDYIGSWVRRMAPNGQVQVFATGLPYGTTDLEIDSAGTLYAISQGAGRNTGRLTIISRQR